MLYNIVFVSPIYQHESVIGICMSLPHEYKHMARCPASLIIREMQIKTTMRYQLTRVRMAIIKKSINSKCWRGYEGNPLTLLVGMQIDIGPMENSTELP